MFDRCWVFEYDLVLDEGGCSSDLVKTSQIFFDRNRSAWVCFSFSRSDIRIGPLMANVAPLSLFLPGVMSVPFRSIWSHNLDKMSIPRRTAGFKDGSSRNSAGIVRPAAVMSPMSLSPKDTSDPSARIATSSPCSL